MTTLAVDRKSTLFSRISCHKILLHTTAFVSKKVRELVELGRVMLAIEKYKKSEASIEKAARIAGVSISMLLEKFKEHGVEANLEYEDYLKGLKSLGKIW
jgi:predicted HTH domain antitoxin